MTIALPTIVINGQGYEVALERISGAQIRAIAGLDPLIDLVVEDAGASGADVLLADEDTVALAGRPRVYTRGPTSFGDPQ